MKRLLSCEFNMDTACVELKFTDGSTGQTHVKTLSDKITESVKF